MISLLLLCLSIRIVVEKNKDSINRSFIHSFIYSRWGFSFLNLQSLCDFPASVPPVYFNESIICLLAFVFTSNGIDTGNNCF